MAVSDLAPNPAVERRYLFLLSVTFTVLAAAFYWGFGKDVIAAIFLCAATIAAAGAMEYRWIGRDVYLVFTLIGAAIQHLISRIAVFLLYSVGVAGCGSIFWLFGMNKLDRCFAACKKRESMFHTVPETDTESFTRQS